MTTTCNNDDDNDDDDQNKINSSSVVRYLQFAHGKFASVAKRIYDGIEAFPGDCNQREDRGIPTDPRQLLQHSANHISCHLLLNVADNVFQNEMW